MCQYIMLFVEIFLKCLQKLTANKLMSKMQMFRTLGIETQK